MPTQKKKSLVQRFTLPDACRVNFKTIDAEHMGLIEILNESLAEFGHHETVAFPDFEKYFRRLWQEMTTHFSHEEAEMEQMQFPQFLGHKHHHAEVLSRLAAVRERAAARGSVNRATIEEIFDTILDDMLQADLGFKTFLFQHGDIR